VFLGLFSVHPFIHLLGFATASPANA